METNNKRLEIYLWFKCNNSCIFCSEYSVMKKNWNNKITNSEILKILIKYKKNWYNHLTFLWWEPFIQPVFLEALIIAKKLWYKVLVTTNATTLWIDKEAKKFLWYIDELILSIHSIDKKLYKKIHNVKNSINYDKIFHNIKKYFNWNFLKINCVLSPYNLDEIENILNYLSDKNVNEFSINYPDVYARDYSLEYKKNEIFIKYEIIKKYIDKYILTSNNNWLNIKFVDIPLCIFSNSENIKLSDDFYYQGRIKIDSKWLKLDRNEILPRNRKNINKCNKCIYNKICWWPSIEYIKIFWNNEINAII